MPIYVIGIGYPVEVSFVIIVWINKKILHFKKNLVTIENRGVSNYNSKRKEKNL